MPPLLTSLTGLKDIGMKAIHRFQARVFHMQGQEAVASELPMVLAENFGFERVVLYLFNSLGNLDAAYANDPRFVPESHVKNTPPEGPMKEAIDSNSPVLIEDPIDGETYFILSQEGEAVERPGKIMDQRIVKLYKRRHDKKNIIRSGILFAPLSLKIPGKTEKIGIIRVDNFSSGNPICPIDTDIRQMLYLLENTSTGEPLLNCLKDPSSGEPIDLSNIRISSGIESALVLAFLKNLTVGNGSSTNTSINNLLANPSTGESIDVSNIGVSREKIKQLQIRSFLQHIRDVANAATLGIFMSQRDEARGAIKEELMVTKKGSSSYLRHVLHELANAIGSLISSNDVMVQFLKKAKATLATLKWIVDTYAAASRPIPPEVIEGPLSVLINLINLISKLPEKDRSKIIKSVKFCRREIDRVKLGIDFSTSLITTDMNSLVRAAARELNGEIKLEISTMTNTYIKTDMHLMKVVIKELIQNAIKFRNGDLELTVTMSLNDTEFSFSMTDNGVGFKPAESQRIFGEGIHNVQGLPLAEGVSSGVGLPNIQDIIVNYFSGRIWAESKGPGKGATFSFTIPIIK